MAPEPTSWDFLGWEAKDLLGPREWALAPRKPSLGSPSTWVLGRPRSLGGLGHHRLGAWDL